MIGGGCACTASCIVFGPFELEVDSQAVEAGRAALERLDAAATAEALADFVQALRVAPGESRGARRPRHGLSPPIRIDAR